MLYGLVLNSDLPLRQTLELADGFGQTFFPDRFEQIVNAVYGECPHGVLVIRRRENDQPGRCGRLQQLKGIAVLKVDVQKYDIGLLIPGEPVCGSGNTAGKNRHKPFRTQCGDH